MPSFPNILLIYTDQQRHDTVAALGNGTIQTPALDGLVREGVSFTGAYCASPVCISSRCSLLLGQWPHQTGCTANTPMPQERTSLMEMLQGAGYQTHGVGKMHFAPDGRKLWGFESRDFSEEGGMRRGDDFCDFLIANGFDHIADAHGVRSEWYYIPQPSQLPERLHHTRWVADRSLDFLKRRDRSRPFLLWSSFIKPHPPFESPVPWNRLYKPIEMPFPYMPRGHEDLLTFWNHVQNRYKYRDQGFDGNLVRLTKCAYYAAVSFIDYHAGRILQRLRDEGELDNTLVIFTSDHGELLGDYGSWGKRTMLDSAARVPLIVRYPERFAPGLRCDEVASAVDVLPTCLAAAGLKPPDDRVGVDLSRLCRGETGRAGVISHFQEEGSALYAFIAGDYKYVFSAPDNREWLFRRAEGQPESNSLAGNPAYEPVLSAMRQHLISSFRADGYEAPLAGDSWRVFPKREVPSTRDAWQLFQEGAPVDHLFPPGYEPRCKPGGGLPVRGI
jgi:arylsulfatase